MHEVVERAAVDGVLNQGTQTVHKRVGDGLGTACGATKWLDQGRLRPVSIEEAVRVGDAVKCGRCFEDGPRGY